MIDCKSVTRRGKWDYALLLRVPAAKMQLDASVVDQTVGHFSKDFVWTLEV